mgnify:CR=1 FL=1
MAETAPDPESPSSRIAIREPAAHEFPEVAELITGLVEPLIAPHCTPDERRLWLESLQADALAAVRHSGVRYVVAAQDDRIVGVGALRDVHHLFHLYVATPWQRRGIGGRLWRALREAAENAGARETYVNAWLDAVPVYLRFGFEPVGSPLRHLGVPRQTMVRVVRSG